MTEPWADRTQPILIFNRCAELDAKRQFQKLPFRHPPAPSNDRHSRFYINFTPQAGASMQDGASHGKGLAKHVTDGDYDTHAKPPGSSFDYRIDLRDGETTRFTINSMVIHWGRFGDRFKGIPKEGGGWATASWPGEYVTSYRLEYRQAGSNEWLPLHVWEGRPVDEKAEGVEVQLLPTDQAGCSSEVIITIATHDIRDVAEVRIHANGSHWIGLYELEVFGLPSAS